MELDREKVPSDDKKKGTSVGRDSRRNEYEKKKKRIESSAFRQN